LAGINLTLALALVILSFEPLRSTFGRLTGLWHPCLPVGGGAAYERWSPTLVLAVAVPVILGVIVAVSASGGRARIAAGGGAAALMLVAVALVAVPSGSCIA
jgi:hypothetical protein